MVFPIVWFYPWWKERQHQTHTHLYLFLPLWSYSKKSLYFSFLADHRLSQLPLTEKPRAAFIERASQEQKIIWEGWLERRFSASPIVRIVVPWFEPSLAFFLESILLLLPQNNPHYLVRVEDASVTLVSWMSWPTPERWRRGVTLPLLPGVRLPRSLGPFCGGAQTADIVDQNNKQASSATLPLIWKPSLVQRRCWNLRIWVSLNHDISIQ